MFFSIQMKIKMLRRTYSIINLINAFNVEDHCYKYIKGIVRKRRHELYDPLPPISCFLVNSLLY